VVIIQKNITSVHFNNNIVFVYKEPNNKEMAAMKARMDDPAFR